MQKKGVAYPESLSALASGDVRCVGRDIRADICRSLMQGFWLKILNNQQ